MSDDTPEGEAQVQDSTHNLTLTGTELNFLRMLVDKDRHVSDFLEAMAPGVDASGRRYLTSSLAMKLRAVK